MDVDNSPERVSVMKNEDEAELYEVKKSLFQKKYANKSKYKYLK